MRHEIFNDCICIPKIARYHALEIYTVITMFLIVCVALFMGELTVIQKFMVFLSFLYILHEWEEGHYPGGFIDLMTTNVLRRDVDTETKRGSRLITGVFLWVFSIVPFFYGDTDIRCSHSGVLYI